MEENSAKKRLRNIIVLVLICLAVTGGAFYFSRTYLVVYPIEGVSMYSTLEDGEFALVFRTHKVKYDDVIIFYYPDAGKHYVKRVIGLEGDKIEIKFSEEDEAYHVYRNGEMVSEEHINEPMRYSHELTVTVPQGKIFFLGDNRNESFDSHHGNVYAEVDKLEGVVFLKYKGSKIKFM